MGRWLLVSSLTFAALVTSTQSVAFADGEEVIVRILPPERLAVGDHAEVIVEVEAPHSASQPLILTPTSEGTAIEVVRGRFLRTDATEQGGVLRFRVPIVAGNAGTSVFRVRVTTYVCTTRCRAIDGDAFVVLRAAPAVVSP